MCVDSNTNTMAWKNSYTHTHTLHMPERIRTKTRMVWAIKIVFLFHSAHAAFYIWLGMVLPQQTIRIGTFECQVLATIFLRLFSSLQISLALSLSLIGPLLTQMPIYVSTSDFGGPTSSSECVRCFFVMYTNTMPSVAGKFNVSSIAPMSAKTFRHDCSTHIDCHVYMNLILSCRDTPLVKRRQWKHKSPISESFKSINYIAAAPVLGSL